MQGRNEIWALGVVLRGPRAAPLSELRLGGSSADRRPVPPVYLSAVPLLDDQLISRLEVWQDYGAAPDWAFGASGSGVVRIGWPRLESQDKPTTRRAGSGKKWTAITISAADVQDESARPTASPARALLARVAVVARAIASVSHG